MSAQTEIRHLSADEVRQHHDEFMELLHDAVANGASVSFVAPLPEKQAAAFWEKVEHQVQSGERIVLASLIGGRVVGCAHLVLSDTPNGLHRAEVQKVLVHSAFRQRGIARKLLEAIDRAACEAGRTLLVLDTEQGSVAEGMYERFGYVRVGSIPQFALNSRGDQLVPTVFFYRLLTQNEAP